MKIFVVKLRPVRFVELAILYLGLVMMDNDENDHGALNRRNQLRCKCGAFSSTLLPVVDPNICPHPHLDESAILPRALGTPCNQKSNPFADSSSKKTPTMMRGPRDSVDAGYDTQKYKVSAREVASNMDATSPDDPIISDEADEETDADETLNQQMHDLSLMRGRDLVIRWSDPPYIANLTKHIFLEKKVDFEKVAEVQATS